MRNSSAQVLLVFLGLNLAVITVPSHAEWLKFDDGNSLLSKCEDGDLFFNKGYCTGLIAGVHDTHSGKSICKPKTAPLKQLKQVVVKFLQENPDKLHYSAVSLTRFALEEAFPCKP
jgi:hypothetical protein